MTFTLNPLFAGFLFLQRPFIDSLRTTQSADMIAYIDPHTVKIRSNELRRVVKRGIIDKTEL